MTIRQTSFAGIKQKGFSLMELMIVVAIIGILTAIALPSYKDYTRRARAAEATSQLASWSSRMEHYYLDNRNYGPGACGIAAPASTYYAFNCATTSAGQGFTLTATAQIESEGTYTASEGGQKQTTLFKGSSVSKSCWLIKGNEC
ncbi:hypothetical protein AZSI13_02900 [Azospira sp. I13]|uniref:type IV pilin protein n=1 Tax=Azospira sp. I13 TaxID=1765050 RepID=UPI000D4B1E6F|nr:type IV pilin protein [Azospira sp. I13]GBG00963.1 hypothetical protein AZSI13_02900 [Azospira sp. I13]